MACSFLASPVASSACPPPALDGSPCSEERALPSLLGCRRSASSLGRVGISGNYSPAGCRNASSLRSDHPRRRWSSGKTPKGKRNDVKAPPRMVAGPFLAIAGPTTGARRDGRPEDRHLEILEAAREKFAEEVSFRSEDKNISIAKALLYIAAEDEAFVAHNRDRDARSVLREMSGDAPETLDAERGRADLESFPLAGKSISGWLHELDTIAKEVEEELASRDASGRRLEALEAVNTVLFERRCFTRSPAGADSEASYLHTALSSGRCSAIMLSCIYKEICRRLGIATQGRPSGEEGFLIWPRTHSAEEELSAMSADRGRFVVVNGRCVRHPGSGDSDQNRESLLGLDAATNRDVIGIALADLIVRSLNLHLISSNSGRTRSPAFVLADDSNSFALGTSVPVEINSCSALPIAATPLETSFGDEPRDDARLSHGICSLPARQAKRRRTGPRRTSAAAASGAEAGGDGVGEAAGGAAAGLDSAEGSWDAPLPQPKVRGRGAGAEHLPRVRAGGGGGGAAARGGASAPDAPRGLARVVDPRQSPQRRRRQPRRPLTPAPPLSVNKYCQIRVRLRRCCPNALSSTGQPDGRRCGPSPGISSPDD